jgi:hypothetical protein
MELTEDQKKKLALLRWSALKNSTWIGLKCGTLLFTANALVILIGILCLPESPQFFVVGTIMNAFFIFRMMGRESRVEHDRIVQETKKILES